MENLIYIFLNIIFEKQKRIGHLKQKGTLYREKFKICFDVDIPTEISDGNKNKSFEFPERFKSQRQVQAFVYFQSFDFSDLKREDLKFAIFDIDNYFWPNLQHNRYAVNLANFNYRYRKSRT